MSPILRSFLTASLVATAIVAGHAASAIAQDEQVETTVVAGQVRSQGYACANPSSAERIAAESAPEEPTYLLICEDATYEVRLVPDQAAKVTRIK